jgi:predicted ATP-dependent protease
MIAALQQQSELLPLEKDAVCRVIEQAAREADDSEKLSLDLESLNRLLQESDHWARERGAAMIARKDIEEAISRERRRHGQLQERMGEQVVRGIRLIDTDGSKVAQVNGLSVLQLGSHSFGAPTRITATARLGSGKVIDIEREAKLGGAIHSKGVMILSAYLADRFAQEKPLPLAASLVFEQSYGGVDGDSASCAELCVLLSAIARIPLNQSLAVTGSMNQLGEVQAIGGVNEKVEGFFEICQSRGLTGEQGVIVPAANAVHLMLRRDIRDAVEAGSFHLYTAEHVDDVMELLSGMPAGEADGDGNYPEGCFNALLAERFSQLQGLQEAQRSSGDKQDETSEQS